MPLIIWFIILGIVEGITEFLPISSTGHLLIAEHWWPKDTARPTDLFNVVIQAGAVLAVIPLFKSRFTQFLTRFSDPSTLDYLAKLFVAFAITCIGGYYLEKHNFKLTDSLERVAWALLVGGILFLVAECFLSKRTPGNDISWIIAIAVGLGQLIAARYPGASRSGSTIIIMLLLGLNRIAATEFSFLVGIPTMLAASGYKIFKALHHPAADAPKENWSMVLLASVVAAVVSFVVVKWLLRYVQSHSFKGFGWYRIAAALFIFALLFLEPKQQAEQPAKVVGQLPNVPSQSTPTL
jgi:undecaprenyl-diphosphatase